MFTNTDYDKLKQLMAESPENEALLRKLLASHRETIGMISHEIRNPLTLVYSTLQLIESQHPEVYTFRHWNSLREDITYMKQLLEDLSAYNNSSTLHLQCFDFGNLMKQIVLSFAADCTSSSIEFTSFVDPALPAIQADPIKLREVFTNLLRNAKEAIIDAGTIYLKAICSENNIVVTITDSGCGIPAHYLNDLFQPFITHKEGGTGLGLAIAKQTIDLHQGTIAVASVPDKGTTFTVTLPIYIS